MSDQYQPPEIYAETLGNATITDGVLLLDFIGRLPDVIPEKSKVSTPVVKQRLIMPMASLINTAKLLNELIKKLEDSGVIVHDDRNQKISSADSSSSIN